MYKDLKRMQSTLYFHLLLLVVTQREMPARTLTWNVNVFPIENIVYVIRNQAYIGRNLRSQLSDTIKPLSWASSSILMGRYNHSLSLDPTIMISLADMLLSFSRHRLPWQQCG